MNKGEEKDGGNSKYDLEDTLTNASGTHVVAHEWLQAATVPVASSSRASAILRAFAGGRQEGDCLTLIKKTRKSRYWLALASEKALDFEHWIQPAFLYV